MRPLTRILRLGANDLRLVRRDAFLLVIAAVPLLTALFLRFGLVPLSLWLEAHWGLELAAHHGFIVSYLVVLMTPFAVGIVLGFMLLDERDERTLEALRVTPVPLRGYLLYRTAAAALLSAVLTPVAWSLADLVLLAPGRLLATALVASLIAPLTALLFVALAENKVQGFGVMKVLNALTLLPVAAYTLPLPWQYAVGLVFPPYWPLRALWSFVDGSPGAWFFLGLGLITQLTLLAFLLRRFDQLIYARGY
ncbi:hypothetical protein BH24DEI1_BH24DEI1_05780 [soil metagenome]|nr:hypothetical protein [Deinococcota bacterium]